MASKLKILDYLRFLQARFSSQVLNKFPFHASWKRLKGITVSGLGFRHLCLNNPSRPTLRHLSRCRINAQLLFPGFAAVAFSLFQAGEDQQAAAAAASEAKLRLLTEVDKLHDAGQEAAAYTKLKSALATGRSADLLWRLAREARAMANAADASEEERKRLTYEAFAMAQEGLQLDPSSSSCHKWMGIMLDLTGRYEGIKQRIRNSYLVKEHFLKAVEHRPNDAVVLHCLGVWCFEVTDLPWYQQKLAAAFFAAPPSSSYDEALEFLLAAEAADPNFYSSNLLYIGKAYLRKGDKANARLYLQRAAHFDGDSHDDRQSKQEAAQLLRSC